MIKNALLLIGFFVSVLTGFSQSGNYIVSKHIPAIDHYNVYYGGAVDQNGVLYLATRNGLIKYDGRNTIALNTGNSVFDISIGADNQLYLATSTGLYLFDDEVGIDSPMQNISNSTDPVFEVSITQEGVYGLSDRTIYYKPYSSDSTLQIVDELAGRFFRMYELGGHFYVNSDNKGVLDITGGKLNSDVPVFLENKTIIFATANADNSKYILGDESGKLSIFDKGKLNKLSVKQRDVIDSEPITALWYDQNTVIIGTLTGGVFFVNVDSGKVEETIDYHSGLDDNEVVGLLQDKNKGVSIISNKSILHISPHIPIRSFEYYEGLKGEVSSIGFVQDQLYVGTNVGLYHLSKITEYKEAVSYRDHTLQILKTKQSPIQKRRRRKTKKNKIETEVIDSVITERITSRRATATYHQYKEVDQMISNVTQIHSLKDRIIVSGLSGVYEVSGESVQTISKSDARYTYLSKDQQKLFVCTGDDQVLVYIRGANSWMYNDIFTDFRASVDHIVEHGDAFWLTSPTQVFEMKISNDELDDVEIFQLNNPYYSNVYGLVSDIDLKFISANFIFDIKADSLVKQSREAIKNIIVDNQNQIWRLSSIGDWISPKEADKLPIFNMLGELKVISYDEQASRYWVVTEENKILKFDQLAVVPTSAYTPFIEETSLGITRGKRNEFVNSQEEYNKLLFVISNSDLPKIFDVKYRHKLAGLDEKWSDWSYKSTIEYNFLPDGQYELQVEASNAFGEKHELDSINFKVLPPYWKRPMFYVFEASFVIFLLILSMQLKSKGYKYRMLSRLLAFLTLVVIIEGVEAVTESYFEMENSPVFGFIIQVIMALIILPFEGLMKKYVFRENVNLKTYFELKGREHFRKS